MNIVLLLTGTVNPGGMSMTALNDTAVRESQYVDSINYWANYSEIKIVFVENSGCDFSNKVNSHILSKKLEFFCFNGNTYDKNLGKGLGELSCIEFALLYSTFLKENPFIFKVTGRYKVLNFDTFLHYIKKNERVDLMVDLKLNLTFADSRFFGFKKEFINEYLLNYKNILNDSESVYFENILTKATLVAVSNGYSYTAMPDLPRICGFSGSLGKEFKSNYIHWMKHRFKYYLKFKSFGLGHMPDF